MFDGSSQATVTAMRYTLPLNRFFRLQAGLSEETQSLDGTSDAAIAAMEKIGNQISDDAESTIFQLIDTLKSAGKSLKATIQFPVNDQVVPVGACDVVGSIEDYCGEFLYLFRGEKGQYWPSRRIMPTGNVWKTRLNVGTKSPLEVLRLVAVNPTLHDYIQYYEAHAAALGHSGIGIRHYPTELDRVRVVADHNK